MKKVIYSALLASGMLLGGAQSAIGTIIDDGEGNPPCDAMPGPCGTDWTPEQEMDWLLEGGDEVYANGILIPNFNVDAWTMVSYVYSNVLANGYDEIWVYDALQAGLVPFNGQLFNLVDSELRISLDTMIISLNGRVTAQLIAAGVFVPASASSVAEQLEDIMNRLDELSVAVLNNSGDIERQRQLLDAVSETMDALYDSISAIQSQLDSNSASFQELQGALDGIDTARTVITLYRFTL